MKRRSLLLSAAALPIVPVLARAAQDTATPASSDGATPSAASGSLVFDATAFTSETKTVTTASGDVEVTYNHYAATPYVANPVDTTYQSLTVSVPTKIGETAIDASTAPILLNINVGGYMSSAVEGATASGSEGGSDGGPGGAMPSANGTPESGMPSGGPSASGTPASGASGDGPGGDSVPSGSGAMVGGGQMVSNGDLALAAGYVVVSPGVRGRDNVDSAGTYFGKAPAAILDLKAAVRYIRANAGRIPGNPDWIISSGGSAGGALSSLLGAAGGSPLYDEALTALGAADAGDAIFAVAAYCPITDLDHADMAYEWMFGGSTLQSGDQVDQTVSTALSDAFADYQASLDLTGANGAGTISADTYGDYLLTTYLQPAATTYLAALSESDRTTYLSTNDWITWSDGAATFAFADFLAHVGRSKSAPAFDSFDLSAAENVLFGNETTNARHFTRYSLRHASDDETADLDRDLPATIAMMNPMTFLTQDSPNAGRARHWWLRVGTSDTDTSLTIVGNLAASTKNLGDDVNALMYWDAGHGANEDAADFIAWIGTITGYAS